MTRLTWGAIGERYYEDGVDRGVLYVDDVGYVWNGLISVSETPTGGEHRSYYLDGIKHINLASAEEYEATIKAISAPAEFAACDGVKSLYQGLFVTQQRRQTFGLSYRSMINNDLGPDVGYKIHLVFNALAAPTERNNATRSDNPEFSERSWYIQAKPPLSMSAMQAQLKANALIKIAGAIALLTASVVALSLIDSGKLTKALTGLSVMFTQLLAAMAMRASSRPSSGACHRKEA